MVEQKHRIRGVEILAAGLTAGMLYFVLCLILLFPAEHLALLGSGFMKFHLFAYTAAFWAVAFCAAAAILYAIAFPLVAASGSKWALVAARFIMYFVLASIFTLGFAVWMYYDRSAPLLPPYILKANIKNLGFLIALSSAAFAFGMSSIVTFGPPRAREALVRRRGLLVAYFLLCLGYVVIANLVPGLITRESAEVSEERVAGRRVVVFGIDAGTWNVVLEFIGDGDLPTMKRMMETGSYGYLATYGRQFTPVVWTSMATGKTLAKHDIHHFGNLSSDWKAAPVWSIASDAGMKVGVANWVCTWPPFEVNGAFISKVISPQTGRVYFSPEYEYLKPLADSIITRWGYEVPADDEARITYAEHELSYISLLDEEVISRVDPDFVALYYYSPDMLKHFFYKDMDPGILRGPDWQGEAPEPNHRHTIRDCYVAADRLLARMMERYGENATYFVLSDHGMRPVSKRMVNFRMNRLLELLGYVSTVSGRADQAVSTCYELEGPPHYRFDIKINPSSYQDTAGRGESFTAVRQRIMADLAGLRVKETGSPLFSATPAGPAPAPEDEPDIHVYATQSALDFSNRFRHVVIRGQDYGLSEFQAPHPWSGKHRARGIFLASGPAIKHRYTGAWIMDDPYTSIFRYIYGVMPRPTGLAPLLRALHLIDEATSLDTAPTFLYLMGLPIAEDMDGRILCELITDKFRGENPVDIVSGYGQAAVSEAGEEDVNQEELKERLKALGYIQ